MYYLESHLRMEGIIPFRHKKAHLMQIPAMLGTSKNNHSKIGDRSFIG